MSRRYSKSNLTKYGVSQSDFLGSYSSSYRRESSQWENECRWAQDVDDEKREFKRNELEWELRNERD